MAQLVKLWDELDLLEKLRRDTLLIIQNCQSVPPVKKLVECHEILDLTHTILIRFPVTPPDVPVCDADALLHMKRLVQEINVFHANEVPQPHFLSYEIKVQTLLRIFRLPREEFERIYL